MNIRDRVRGAMRRVGEVSKQAISYQPSAVRNLAAMQGSSSGSLRSDGIPPLHEAQGWGSRLFTSLLARGRGGRRTAGVGSNLAPLSSPGFASPLIPGKGRGSALYNSVPKPTPVNLRRFAETPVARRAINVIKDRISGMRWRIQVRSGRSLEEIPDGAARIRILTQNFQAPNPDDSFRSLLEQVLEDVIVGGFGAIEIDKISEQWPVGGGRDSRQPSAISHQSVLSSQFPVLSSTGDREESLEPQRTQRNTEEGNSSHTAPQLQSSRQPSAVSHQEKPQYPGPSTQTNAEALGRTGVSALRGPLVMWPVDGATIRILPDWDGRPDSPRYVQVTGLSGANGQIVLNDDELSYIRLNPRTHTPFGLGRVEVAFETINAFLSAHRYAGRLASNSVVQYALWLQGLTPANHERLIRWWQDEIEGTGRVPIMSAESKPEVLRFGAGTDADLRLAWQEFLLRIIADAFDLPAQFLGVIGDVNRATAEAMNEMAFRSAIVPTARLVAEYLTRDAIGKKLGWTDLEFVFTDVDASDEMEQAQIDEILLRNGIVTVNEVRRARGLGEIL